MRIYSLLVLLIIGIFIGSADAQFEGVTQMEFKEMLQKQLNEMERDWKLYGSSKEYNIELYYNAANIAYPSGGSVIVAVKTVFEDEIGINELKRVRKHNLKTSSINSEDLKYDNFSHTIETKEIYCNIKKFKTMDIILDVDKGNNILNLVPSTQGIPFDIYNNSTNEKLYEIVCPKDVAKKIETVIYKFGNKALIIKGSLIEHKKLIIEINEKKIIEEDIDLTTNKPLAVMSGLYDQKQLSANCGYDYENLSTIKCTIILDSEEIAKLIFK